MTSAWLLNLGAPTVNPTGITDAEAVGVYGPKTNNAQGGTVGASVTTGNSGGVSGDAWNTVTVAASGSVTYANDPAGTSNTVITNYGGGTGAGVFGRVIWNPVGGTEIHLSLRFRVTALLDYLAYLSYTGSVGPLIGWSAGKIRINTSAGAALATGTAVLAVDTWYTAQIDCLPGTSCTVTVYSSTGSLLDTITYTGSAHVAAGVLPASINVGYARGNVTQFFDDIRYSGSSAVAVVPRLAPGSLTDAGALAGATVTTAYTATPTGIADAATLGTPGTAAATSHALADLSAASDAATVTRARRLVDGAASTDTVGLERSTVATDAAAAADAATLRWLRVRGLAEVASSFDAVALTMARVLVDSAGTADATSNTATLRLADTASAADATQGTRVRQLADVAGATDTFTYNGQAPPVLFAGAAFADLGADTIRILVAPWAVPGVRHGEHRRDWARAAVTVVNRCSVQPYEATEQTVDRDFTETHLRLFAPPGVPLDAGSRVIFSGLTYDVDGEPQTWRDLDGRPSHVEATLKRVTG